MNDTYPKSNLFYPRLIPLIIQQSNSTDRRHLSNATPQALASQLHLSSKIKSWFVKKAENNKQDIPIRDILFNEHPFCGTYSKNDKTPKRKRDL